MLETRLVFCDGSLDSFRSKKIVKFVSEIIKKWEGDVRVGREAHPRLHWCPMYFTTIENPECCLKDFSELERLSGLKTTIDLLT